MRLIVTGGSSGVGAALVARLSAHQVSILDVQAPQSMADGHEFIACDLSDESSIDQVLSQLGDNINGLANVAGIARADDGSKVIAVNFLGLRKLSEGLIPKLTPGAAIVNVSSIAGRDWQNKYERLLPLLKTQNFAEGMAWCKGQNEYVARDPYTLSKRLATAYTLNLAQKGLHSNFRVNCVSPGPIATPLYPAFEALMGKEQSDWSIEQTKRAAEPAEIAQVIDLLLTGECGWLNGVDVPVDGGYTAGISAGWIDFSNSPVMLQRRGK